MGRIKLANTCVRLLGQFWRGHGYCHALSPVFITPQPAGCRYSGEHIARAHSQGGLPSLETDIKHIITTVSVFSNVNTMH